MSTSTLSIQVPGNHLMPGLLGQRDEFLRLVEAGFTASEIHVRGNLITVAGDGASKVVELFNELVKLMESGEPLSSELVDRTIQMVKANEKPSEILTHELLRSPNGRRVRPKSSGQKAYAEAIDANTITFAIGPAGTGKTWLAVAAAVQALHRKQVTRLILTRPAVEAGERLGFLPGDLASKIDPYMRPLFDALHDMLDTENVQRLMERGTIEVAPLAFMRGRTLNDAFIILDEAQNTTPEQMKMFLTRIGFGSKVVITGDPSQTDVPGGRSGLSGLEDMLSGIEGIEFARLGGRDIVRHRIVQRIVDAYESKPSKPKRR